MPGKFKFLFFVLFIEGAALMAVELMAAKLVAPFYGSSLYVWTTVLVSTIAGLTMGYYTGGVLSQKTNTARTLATILGIASSLVLALPYTATVLMRLTSAMDLAPGICVTCLLLIVPVLLCFGMVGPIAVKLMNVQPGHEGAAAGKVYFTSTAGGIAATFLFGYCLIPFAGLKCCSLITAFSLAAIPIIYFVTRLSNKQQDEQPIAPTNKEPEAANTQPMPLTIYGYAALEGAVVMAIELIAARMMAPYFGASLFVWAAIIGFTLSGLAIGYYAGGKLADKYEPLVALQWTLLGASALLMMMHYVCQQLTIAFEATSFNTAVVIISMLLVVPPLALLGMVPTLLIKYLSLKTGYTSAATGRVYALSSASGIVSLLLFGFIIIPAYGLTAPSIITGILAGAVPMAMLLTRKKYLSLLFVGFILFSWSVKKTFQPSANIEVQHYSEGMLGQVLVADVTNNNNGVLTTDRILYLNRIGETFINKNTGNTEANYLVYAACIASKYKAHSNALLLGLGGGTIANMLVHDLQFNVDVAELDKRIADVSRDYFSLNKDVHVVVDDARHYLEQTNKKYDVIFFDVFRGDIPPPHVLSLESFKKAASLLNKDGMIVVNFYGFLSGDIGKAGRSVYKTLCAAGLNTRILPTTGTEEERNLLFVASPTKQTFDNLRQPLYLFGKPVAVDTMFVENKIPEINNAMIFTDDKPILDLMVLSATNNFREYFDHNHVKMFWENGVPLFE